MAVPLALMINMGAKGLANSGSGGPPSQSFFAGAMNPGSGGPGLAQMMGLGGNMFGGLPNAQQSRNPLGGLPNPMAPGMRPWAEMFLHGRSPLEDGVKAPLNFAWDPSLAGVFGNLFGRNPWTGEGY